MSEAKQYAERDLMEMDYAGNHYCRHVSAMTREGLHSKSDIAAELGWRDMKIAALQQKMDAAEKKVEKFAVQCAAAKIAAAYAKEGRHDYSLNTPDIDTYLNSVRADAIVEAASRIAAQVWEEDEGAGMVAAVNALAIIEKEIRAGEAK